VLGEDGSECQGAALGLEDLVPPIATWGPDKKLSHADADRVRVQYQKTLGPGLAILFETFQPYCQYIQRCVEIEERQRRDSDLAQHAFMQLRFGTSRATQDIIKPVQEKFSELLGVCAFGDGKSFVDDALKRTSTWEEYATWFVDAVNLVHADGWFYSYDKQLKEHKKLLTHVAFDASGSIVNYKLEHQSKALGALVLALVFHRGRTKDAKSSKDIRGAARQAFDDVVAEVMDRLPDSVRPGLRKYYKAQLVDFVGTPAQIKAEVAKKTDAGLKKYLQEFRSFFGVSES
jgi:hypothetical protein